MKIKEIQSETKTVFFCPYCSLEFDEETDAEECREGCHKEIEKEIEKDIPGEEEMSESIPHIWDPIKESKGAYGIHMYRCVACDKETHIGLDIDYEAEECSFENVYKKIKSLQSQLGTYKKAYGIQRGSSDFYESDWTCATLASATSEGITKIHEQFFVKDGGKSARAANEKCDEILKETR